MYLKSIEVHGFKSFAQKINFEFHNGITGIVGPNGSGKSNVGDAVRWVLGEQSAKQLRGGNMQDVIFAGTENRKPLSYASVAITLDNSDHKLAVDYNEVTVTRRLYRSGESEYLINGSSCRLKDINEMFYDTGIGKEGYSIIGQGQIDKILSGKPEDRRELFDEAAGIVKFKRRKATALKKLEEEKQNLTRVTDILSELTKQLEPLERQSETAKIYLARKEELKQLDVNMFLLEMEYLAGQEKEVQEKNLTAKNQLEATKEQYEQAKREYERLEEQLEQLNEKMEDLRDKSQSDALRKQQMEGQINVLLEQIHSAQANDNHYRTRLESIEEELRKRQEELEEYKKSKEALWESSQSILKEKEKQENALKVLKDQIEETSQAVEEGKNEIIELLNRRANTKGKIQRYDAMMEQVNIRKAQLSQSALNLKTEEEQQQSAVGRAQKEYEAITGIIEDMNREGRKLKEESDRLRELIAQQSRQLENGQRAYHREASRLESMRNITERYDGYGNSIRRVMEQKSKVPGIRGVVADLIQVNKDYEIAIETALGGSIQNIVTDHEQTAKQMIQFLKQNRYGRATFLPLNHISSRGEFTQKEALKEPGVIGLASQLVQVEGEYQNLSRYLLGKTLVVDHIDHAIAIGKKYRHTIRMVTIEGESLNPGGSMTGGAFKNNSNLLGRRREIEELEESVQRLKNEMDTVHKQMDNSRSQRNMIGDTIAELREKLQNQYILQNTAKLNLEKLKEQGSSIQGGYEKIRQEQKEIATQLKAMEENKNSIEEELKESSREEKELEMFIASRQEQLDTARQEEEQLSRDLEGIRMEVSSLEQKEGFLKENLSRLSYEQKNFEREREQIQESIRQGVLEKQEKEQQIETIRKEMKKTCSEEEDAKEQLLYYQKEKEEMGKTHKEFFSKRDQLSQQMGLLDKECFRLNSQLEKLEESKEGQIAYMWEEYEITPNTAVSYKKEDAGDRQEMKKQISQLKDAIRRLGSVNVNAIEDYKNLLERHTFLSAQYEDLITAEKTLMGIIAELDEGMRKQFSEKFKDIQREFDKAFKELFGGGKGTIELTEDEDILEAGVRIISQPPGKKLQNMMQLSGGEKALTAIALLFAIQNLKPSPFCLLDEIEAALDDSNVDRFAGYLKKLTKNTQFIIITHRRGTMNAADRLYGITMQEKGVSTLVSVDLVEKDLEQ